MASLNKIMEQRLSFIKNVYVKKYIRSNGYIESKPYDLYKCVCGNNKIVSRLSVKSKAQNSTWSCGCITRETLKKINQERKNVHKTHSGHPAHNKGKIEIIENGKIRYIWLKELNEIYHSKP